MSTRPPIRVSFLDGASEIGASSALVQVAGTSLLVDAGVRVPANGDELAQALKAENPKGALLELCMRRRLPTPKKTETSTGDAHTAELSIDTGERALTSGPHRATSKKLAEQLAARALLALLDPQEPTERAEPPNKGNPKGQLNQMKQLGTLTGFGYEVVEQRGPSHQPTFVMRGWVDAANLEREHTEPVEAKSRKEGEGLLAARMLALAVELSEW